MRSTPYYSVRTGQHPSGGRFDLPMLRDLFFSFHREFEVRGYFQQAFGYYCRDADYVYGAVGRSPEHYVFRVLKKNNLWPINGHSIGRLAEADIFDLIEFLYDHASKGMEGYEHTYDDCGWHYRTFDRDAGRVDFRTAINDILRDYDVGYELTLAGEIVSLPPAGFAELEAAMLPETTDATVAERVNEARHKFRRRGASAAERRDALRDLADVLEHLRPRAKQVLTKKDERDLFELANRFGIRHLNARQQTDYDPAIWQSWIFYHYLATIHACTRLIEREGRTDGAHHPG